MPPRNLKIYFIWSICLLAVAGIASYAYGRTYDLMSGPRLVIISPQSGETESSTLITIEGKAYNATSVTLNDRPIFTDENGIFKEALLLSYGYNELTLKARDKFGHVVKKTLALVYK